MSAHLNMALVHPGNMGALWHVEIVASYICKGLLRSVNWSCKELLSELIGVNFPNRCLSRAPLKAPMMDFDRPLFKNLATISFLRFCGQKYSFDDKNHVCMPFVIWGRCPISTQNGPRNVKLRLNFNCQWKSNFLTIFEVTRKLHKTNRKENI